MTPACEVAASNNSLTPVVCGRFGLSRVVSLAVLLGVLAVCAMGVVRVVGDDATRDALGDLASTRGASLVLAALACGAFGLAFIASRAWVLSRAAQACGVDDGGHDGSGATWRACGRGFVEGACVEVVSWPGKVWADAYRQWLWRPAPVRHRLAGIALFRVCTALGSLGCVALAGLVLAREGAGATMAGAAALVAAIIVLRRRLRGATSLGAGATRAMPGLTLGAMLGTLVDAASFGLVAWIVAGLHPLAIMPMVVLVGFVGAASTLPLGLGVVDAGLWWVLTQVARVPHAESLATIVMYRACGPGLTLGLGVVSMGMRVRGEVVFGRAGHPTQLSAGSALGTDVAGDTAKDGIGAVVVGKSANVHDTPRRWAA